MRNTILTMRISKKDGIDEKTIKQKIIARNLKSLLKQHNLNANQLAHFLGIPMMTVRRLLSGETEDPRISTLKLIADFFKVSIDFFIGEYPLKNFASSQKIKSFLIPKLNWEVLHKLLDIDKFNVNEWSDWQSFTLNNSDVLSKKAFAIESRPSMFPRFPKGTVFIIDPETQPTDGDIVLIKFKDNNEFTLRELVVDPPIWRLSPLILDSNIIEFSSEQHEIIGVSLLTLLYHPKLNG